MTDQGIPKIEQGAAFLAALEHHVNKMLVALHLDMASVSWSGAEAAAFANMLEIMGDWIEGPGYRAQMRLHVEIAELTGLEVGEDKKVVRANSLADYGGILPSIVDSLRLGSLPGHSVAFEGRDLHAIKSVTDDLVRRVFVIVPRAIKDLEDLKGDVI